jgi:MFS family permease
MPGSGDGPVLGRRTEARRGNRRDVVATFVVFATFGAVAGTWFARVPAVRGQLDASLRTLGFVMLCFAVGSLLAMPFTGRLVQRFSIRAVCVVASVGGSTMMVIIALISRPVPFAGVLFVAGVCYGTWNVTMNVHAAAVEARLGRTLMPAFHGTLSAGIILGSVSGAALAGAGLNLIQHFGIVVPPLVAASVVAAGFWRDGDRPEPRPPTTAAHDEDGPVPRPSRVLTAPVLLVGLLAFCCALAQGATSDWLAIHAHDDKGLTEALAAAVFSAYAVSEAVGRFTGGRVIDRVGRVRTLRFGGLLAAIGVAATIILPGSGLFVGAALWGLGLSVVEPLTVTVAGEIGGEDAPRTVSAVATMGWAAFLVGAPVMGLLGQQFSLSNALWLIVALALVVSLLAGATAPARPRPITPPG